jgi:hypothetical protein
MKKLFLFIIICLFISFINTSCKKCKTCEIKYKSLSGEKIKTSQECGNKKDLKNFEEFQKALADSLDGTLNCYSEE